MKSSLLRCFLLLGSCFCLFACKEKNAPAKDLIAGIDLKKGDLIVCGPADKQFGTVVFETSCSETVKEDFNLGVKLLHSFEYDEAEKAFAKVIDKDPSCAMAYWGVAMSNFHPLWTPPSEPELQKGSKAIDIAQSIAAKSEKETGYINAIASFYKDWNTTDHRTRALRFEKGMEDLYTKYPDDHEAAIFYALSLDAAADPSDKTFQKQQKAGDILTALYAKYPDHPGIVHYIIHTYDYPELADKALEAARRYASVAPSSAHALHMPSHIFTRLGLWDEDIKSNIASVSSAQCYAQSSGIKGHWDEELHGLDYLVYSYLQKGNNDSAKKEWDYMQQIKQVSPFNFKVAYSFAAVPARYALENKDWKQAANLTLYNEQFPWKNFPWQKGLLYFGRVLGNAHTGNFKAAYADLDSLKHFRDALLQLKDAYKANQVDIQVNSGEAWIKWKEGKKNEALALMAKAADMEDKTEKHPVTPGEVLPAKELLGDMLMEMNQPAKALEMYEADLKKHANRFNGLYGAGLAAERSGNKEKASAYYRQLIQIADPSSTRVEIAHARQYARN